MVTSWRQNQDHSHLGNLVHRASPQAAWVEPGTTQTHQALLSQFMLTPTKASMHDTSHQHDGSDAAADGVASQQPKSAAGRGYRSQPSSPARTRRSGTGSDHAQQYGLLASAAAAAYGQLAVTAAGSPRQAQSGTWGRPSSGRPSSNPAPSRGAGHLSSSAQMGRTTPSRAAGVGSSRGSSAASQHKFVYGYEQQPQQTTQQLGDFFTATSLKAPQRYDQSPYLKSSSKSAQASTAVAAGLSSPRSPRGKPATVGSAGNSGSYSRQQLGALYNSSPDPVGRMKTGAGSATSGKVTASQEGFKPSRGPGALIASSSRGTMPSNTSATSTTAQFRSSTSTRYNATPGSSTSSSRAGTPQASLATHKQSLHQQQQQQQLRQSQTPPAQQRSASGQQQQLQQQQLSPASSSFQQQPSQPYISASGQFSGLLINTSSSTVSGRPQTARGSSRAELRAADSTVAAGAAAGPGTPVAAAGQAGGMNLDPQSWSTFLAMSSNNAGTDVAGLHRANRSRTPSEAGQNASSPQQAPQRQQQQQQVPTVVPRNLQAQMLSDLGLGNGNSPADVAAGSTASTQQRQPSGSMLAAEQQQQQQSPAPGSRPPSTPRGSRGSILHAPGSAAAAAAGTAMQQQQQQQQVSSSARRTSGDECPPSPSAAAAGAPVPGPLHAGLMRPRSANSMLQLAQQPPVQLPVAQQQQQVPSTPPPSSYLQTLQQQQQQHSDGSSTSSLVPVRMAGQPVTPLSALRRRSNAAEMTAAAAGGSNSPVGHASAANSASGAALLNGTFNGGSDSPMAGSPATSYYQQQWGSRTDDGAQAPSPRTTILAAQQQLLQSAGNSPLPLRRVGSVDIANSGASSPGLSRLQGEWGTLTAMSAFRASGYGASLAESSTELSCSSPACGSAASWSSMAGAGPPAHLVSSMAAAAAAAAAAAGSLGGTLATGGSSATAPVGPGPSPLSRPSSTTGTPQHAGSVMQYQGSSGGIGSFGSPSVGARRALNFSYGDGGSPVPAAAAAGAVRRAEPAPAPPVRQDAQQAAMVEDVPGQQSSSTAGSYPGSRSSSFSAQQVQTAAAAAGALPPSQQSAIQQQHQSMEQRLNQLQQMHQAYKQQLQQAARLLEAAAGNATSTAAPQQRQQQLQMTTAPAAIGGSDAAAGNLERPAPPAAAVPSRRESNSSAAAAADSTAQTAIRSSAAAATGWSIPASPQQQQQQQQQQQATRPASRPSQDQPQQQQQQQQQRRDSSAGSAAAAAVPRTSTAAQPSGAGPAPVQTAARPASAVRSTAAAAAAPSSAAAAASAPSGTSAAGAGAASSVAASTPAAAGSSTTAAPAAAAADSASEPLMLAGYSVGAVVGEGGFCQVRLAVHHLSRRRVAVKVIDKTKLSDAAEARRMQREIRVMKRVNHPCVIRLFEVLEAGSKLLLVMEYAPGGSLLDYVRGRKRLGEAEAAYFLQQILVGLQYCHDSEVVHRDIKLENILLDSSRAMKLIDFGLAAFYAPGKKLRVHCGSPSYAAPEIVARKMYEGPPVDVWSLGVVLFAMLAGFLPFHSPTGNKQELCQKIMAGTFNTPDWLSPGARDLLGRMLTVDPDARITLADAIQHPWARSSGIVWELPATYCYSLSSTHSTSNGTRSSSNSSGEADGHAHRASSITVEGIEAQASILEELEGHGYSRSAVVRYLAASECNYITASYYLLAEARQEAAQKLLPAKAWPFQPVAVSSRSSGSSRSRAASSSAAGARPASGVAAPSGGSRAPSGVPAAAAGAGYGTTGPATAVAVSS